MSNSKRHHYIPQYFTRNFTDTDGLLFVFNKIENKIIERKMSPKSIFFEIDRNTVDFSGHLLDNLEKMYADLDHRISQDLSHVLKTKTVTPEELTSIALLASQLKWRVPKVDQQFNLIKDDLTQDDLSIKITVKDENVEIDKRAIEEIEKSDIFKEGKRILLSILPFLKEPILLDIHNNSFIQTNEYFPCLIGDCPVLEKPNENIRVMEDFIFPLSSSDTFIYKKGCNKKIKSILFFFQRDLAIIDLSSKYVGCKDKEHLGKVVKMYNLAQNEGKAKFIYKYLFENID